MWSGRRQRSGGAARPCDTSTCSTSASLQSLSPRAPLCVVSIEAFGDMKVCIQAVTAPTSNSPAGTCRVLPKTQPPATPFEGMQIKQAGHWPSVNVSAPAMTAPQALPLLGGQPPADTQTRTRLCSWLRAQMVWRSCRESNSGGSSCTSHVLSLLLPPQPSSGHNRTAGWAGASGRRSTACELSLAGSFVRYRRLQAVMTYMQGAGQRSKGSRGEAAPGRRRSHQRQAAPRLQARAMAATHCAAWQQRAAVPRRAWLAAPQPPRFLTATNTTPAAVPTRIESRLGSVQGALKACETKEGEGGRLCDVGRLRSVVRPSVATASLLFSFSGLSGLFPPATRHHSIP